MRHNKLIDSMVDMFRGDARRINHFLKVYAYAKTIAEEEHVISMKEKIFKTTTGLRYLQALFPACFA